MRQGKGFLHYNSLRRGPLRGDRRISLSFTRSAGADQYMGNGSLHLTIVALVIGVVNILTLRNPSRCPHYEEDCIHVSGN